jgi:hypothetical protein
MKPKSPNLIPIKFNLPFKVFNYLIPIWVAQNTHNYSILAPRSIGYCRFGLFQTTH